MSENVEVTLKFDDFTAGVSRGVIRLTWWCDELRKHVEMEVRLREWKILTSMIEEMQYDG